MIRRSTITVVPVLAATLLGYGLLAAPPAAAQEICVQVYVSGTLITDDLNLAPIDPGPICCPEPPLPDFVCTDADPVPGHVWLGSETDLVFVDIYWHL